MMKTLFPPWGGTHKFNTLRLRTSSYNHARKPIVHPLKLCYIIEEHYRPRLNAFYAFRLLENAN